MTTDLERRLSRELHREAADLVPEDSPRTPPPSTSGRWWGGAWSSSRWRTPVLAAAVVVVIALAAALLVQRPWAPTPAADGPTDGNADLVASSPRGLAAAVMAHVSEGRLVKLGGEVTSGDQAPEPWQGSISVMIAYRVNGHNVMLAVNASPHQRMWAHITTLCQKHERTCRVSHLRNGGDLAIIKVPQNDRKNASLYHVAAKRGSQVVVVTESDYVDIARLRPASKSHGQPVLGMSTLRAIATDPLVGMATSTQMLHRGAGLDQFRQGVDSVDSDDFATPLLALVTSQQPSTGRGECALDGPRQVVCTTTTGRDRVAYTLDLGSVTPVTATGTKVLASPQGSRWQVRVTLDKSSAQALTDLTRQAVQRDQKMAVVYRGRALRVIQVADVLHTRQLVLTGMDTKQQAEDIAARFAE